MFCGNDYGDALLWKQGTVTIDYRLRFTSPVHYNIERIVFQII